MTLEEFHFIRPLWLLALLPLLGLIVALLHSHGQDSQWQRWVDNRLLNFLLDKQQMKSSRWPLWGLAVAWLVATLAAAGPTWEKLPQPVVKKRHSLVVLWDLSPSMLAEDLTPDRLTRSRYKLTDLLNAKREGEAALVVYGGEAHVVTPMTDDMDTIIAQLPALEPDLMPIPGSNTEMAVETAIKLFKEAKVFSGEILLVTDGVVPQAISTISDLLAGYNHKLSVLAVGTQEGAPVPYNNGFARNNQGKLIIDRVDYDQLKRLAENNGGRFTALRSDNLDVEYLLAGHTGQSQDQFQDDQDQPREFDQWLERGPYLALLLLPFAALSFRRGWILQIVLPLGLGLSVAEHAKSLEWQDLWQTQDQRARQLLQQGQAEQAAELFKDPNWSASAKYKSGEFDQAAELFDKDSAQGLYNYGNALAQAGRLEEALNAYDQALAKKPDFEDAQYNRNVVEQRLQQSQQSQQQNGGDQDQQNSDQQQSDEQQTSEQEQQNQEGQQGQQDQSQSGEQNQSTEQQSQDQSDQQQSEQQQAANDQQAQQEQDEQKKLSENYSDALEDQQQEKQEQAAAQPQQNEAEQTEGEQNQQAQINPLNNNLTEEQQQALEQWLKQVPDDPSGLLKRKFQHQYRQRRQEYRTGQWQLPSNNAASRL